MPETVRHLTEALKIIDKYVPNAAVIIEEQYYLINTGNIVLSESDLHVLRRLGWSFEDRQIYKIR